MFLNPPDGLGGVGLIKSGNIAVVLVEKFLSKVLQSYLLVVRSVESGIWRKLE
jgi:hypothetical protein